jgi:ABC-type uncharacterized transport system substrate-binding protein
MHLRKTNLGGQRPAIGVLCPTTCVGPALDAFRSALGEQGLREGHTVTLIYREAEGQLHRRKRVFDFAATHRLPAIYETDYEFYARDGGLMSYGGNLGEIYERAAALTHRILEGAKPAELPFEQPTRYDLVINLKAAKAIGLDVPFNLLARADEVIE